VRIYVENVWVRRLISLLFLTFVWEVSSRTGVINPFYAPAPSEILRVVVTLFIEGTIFSHLEVTFTAALAGLVFGLALGILLGFAAALIPIVADVLEPVMMILNAIPRVIMAPLFVIWLGIELPSKVALAVVLVAVLIFFAVYSGIKDVNQLLVDRVRTLGGGRRILLREVYIPSVTAWVLGSLKVAVGFAFTGAVVGEFVAATRGLGYLLQFAQSTYNAALTMGLIFLIMTFVLLLFIGAEALERRLLRWREHPDRLTKTDSRYSVENFLRAKAHYLQRGPLRERDGVILWGAGQVGRRLSKHLLREGAQLAAFVDIDPRKIGRTLRERPVIPPGELPSTWKRFQRPALLVAVATRGARGLIRERLEQLGMLEGQDWWAVA